MNRLDRLGPLLYVCTGLTLALLPSPVAFAETCRFIGTTTHDGNISASVTTSHVGDETTVDVSLTFAIAAMTWNVHYYGEEISIWHGRKLQTLAVNQRTVIDDHIGREQWDVFYRRGSRLEGYRVQAKTLADFSLHHPAFAEHWPLESFGQPWLPSYQAANPDRRPDLDIEDTSGPLQTPLAFTFYWSRFLPAEGARATVVLPGFKRDKTSLLSIGAAVPGEGWLRWSAPLIHPGLETSPQSLAAVWVSPQHYLLQIGFDVSTSWASGRALLRPQGCEGVELIPD